MAGSVFQRKDGRWVASLRVGGGRKVLRYAHSKDEALLALAQLQLAFGLGQLPQGPGIKLGDYLAHWLSGKEIRPSTRAAYERARVAWSQELGGVRLAQLTPIAIDACLRRWAQARVGARTREQRWAMLHAALTEAARLGLIGSNPVDRVLRPRYRRPEWAPWTLEQARAFLDHALDSKRAHADLLGFLLLSGLRLSEALGLTTKDLLPAGRVVVRQGVVWVGGVAHIQPPKTAAGRRVVALPGEALEILEARARAVGAGPLFVTRTGSPPRKDNLGRLMAALCREAGVPRIEVRQLRRVHAAVMVLGGLDVKSLQAHLGHTRATLSLDLYPYPLNAEGTRTAWDRGWRRSE